MENRRGVATTAQADFHPAASERHRRRYGQSKTYASTNARVPTHSSATSNGPRDRVTRVLFRCH
jgi:hypothetical protein